VYSKKILSDDDQVYFFDKHTGEKFAKLSSVLLNDINHHHLKSEITGKTVLLSEFGIQRRFSVALNDGIKSRKICFFDFSI